MKKRILLTILLVLFPTLVLASTNTKSRDGLANYGVVIRNGVVYRSAKNNADVAVLYRNGELKTYRSNNFNV